jgi:hypothetical protein
MVRQLARRIYAMATESDTPVQDVAAVFRFASDRRDDTFFRTAAILVAKISDMPEDRAISEIAAALKIATGELPGPRFPGGTAR